MAPSRRRELKDCRYAHPEWHVPVPERSFPHLRTPPRQRVEKERSDWTDEKLLESIADRIAADPSYTDDQKEQIAVDFLGKPLRKRCPIDPYMYYAFPYPHLVNGNICWTLYDEALIRECDKLIGREKSEYRSEFAYPATLVRYFRGEEHQTDKDEWRCNICDRKIERGMEFCPKGHRLDWDNPRVKDIGRIDKDSMNRKGGGKSTGSARKVEDEEAIEYNFANGRPFF